MKKIFIASLLFVIGCYENPYPPPTVDETNQVAQIIWDKLIEFYPRLEGTQPLTNIEWRPKWCLKEWGRGCADGRFDGSKIYCVWYGWSFHETALTHELNHYRQQKMKVKITDDPSPDYTQQLDIVDRINTFLSYYGY